MEGAAAGKEKDKEDKPEVSLYKTSQELRMLSRSLSVY